MRGAARLQPDPGRRQLGEELRHLAAPHLPAQHRLPTCCSADNPPRYPPITYGEYRVRWLNTNYGAKLGRSPAPLPPLLLVRADEVIE
jgi:hypothetical protein